MIEVKALKDSGEIFTDNGPVLLKKNNYYFLKRSDVEPLVKQNLAEQVVKR